MIGLLLLAVLSQQLRPALAVAADSTAPLHERAVALQQLGRSCSPGAVRVLLPLARPYIGEWVIWHGALAALANCPYEELAPFWRETITFPRRPVREIAIVGLLRTGVPADIAIVREAAHRETDSLIVRLAERADSVLRLPVSARARLLK